MKEKIKNILEANRPSYILCDTPEEMNEIKTALREFAGIIAAGDTYKHSAAPFILVMPITGRYVQTNGTTRRSDDVIIYAENLISNE